MMGLSGNSVRALKLPVFDEVFNAFYQGAVLAGELVHLVAVVVAADAAVLPEGRGARDDLEEAAVEGHQRHHRELHVVARAPSKHSTHKFT